MQEQQALANRREHLERRRETSKAMIAANCRSKLCQSNARYGGRYPLDLVDQSIRAGVAIRHIPEPSVLLIEPFKSCDGSDCGLGEPLARVGTEYLPGIVGQLHDAGAAAGRPQGP